MKLTAAWQIVPKGIVIENGSVGTMLQMRVENDRILRMCGDDLLPVPTEYEACLRVETPDSYQEYLQQSIDSPRPTHQWRP